MVRETSEKNNFFKVRKKSGNFVSSLKNCKFCIEVLGEKSGFILSSHKVFKRVCSRATLIQFQRTFMKELLFCGLIASFIALFFFS